VTDPALSAEYPSDTILDSRRLTGPNLFSTHVGAVLEVAPSAVTAERVQRWRGLVAALRTRVGWPLADVAVRRRPALAQLFIAAPPDGLLTATAVNEQAWALAVALSAEAASDDAPAFPADADARLEAVADALRTQWLEEHARFGRAALLNAAARAHGAQCLIDEEIVSIGTGVGAQRWAIGAEPDPAEVAWTAVHDIPIALVTGSNGKTTTTRLLAAMWRTAGRCVGWSCSDGVMVALDGAVHALEHGDFTGPGGARRVLRDTRVQAAVLETARGGLLRRGLAMTRADVAVITNIAADHFGEYGVSSLADLAEAKALVAQVLDGPIRTLVLNAHDAELVLLDVPEPVRVAWFAVPTANGEPTDAAVARVQAGVSVAGVGALVQHGQLRVAIGGTWHTVGLVTDFPCTLQGTARHNIENLTAAAAAAGASGVPLDAITKTLHHFGGAPDDNPGRLMQRELGGVSLLLDYAHNPEGIAALCATAAALSATRRLLLLGQAGNREDDELRALAHASWRALAFDRVILKEMPEMSRGREAGVVTALLRAALLEAGAPDGCIGVAPSEVAGVQAALAWARPGDVLVLGIHVERERVLQLLDVMAAQGWRAGEALPHT
jgi:cyanophycin synthetase